MCAICHRSRTAQFDGGAWTFQVIWSSLIGTFTHSVTTRAPARHNSATKFRCQFDYGCLDEKSCIDPPVSTRWSINQKPEKYPTEADFLYRHQVGTNTPFAHHSFSISILASFIHKRRPTIGSSKADTQGFSLRLCNVWIKARLSLGGRSGSVMRNDRTLS
jgi:hypothetical protein